MSGHAEISEEPARLREINSRLAVVTLPPELLSEIFLECINRGALDRFNPHFSVASLRRTRSSLAGVCYRWRQVAQTTKSLWAVTAFPGNITNVWSDENGGSYEIPPPTHKLFHHELQLSDPTPLALVSHSIITVLPPPYMISTVKRDLCAELSPVLARCNSVFLAAPSDIPLIVLNAAPKHLSNVTSLDVRSWGCCTEEDDKIELLDLSHADALQDLSIEFSNRFTAHAPLPIASPKLSDTTHLRNLSMTGYIDSIAAYEIISGGKSLHSLTWSGIDGSPTFPTPQQCISLPLLHYLSLSESTPVSLLPCLHVPELRCLILTDSHERTQLSPFLAPAHFPRVRALTLNSSPYALSPLLPAVVPGLHGLEVLSLWGSLSMELSAACAQATKLRVVVAEWNPRMPSRWGGALQLLRHWSNQVNEPSTSSLSYGLCLVHHWEPSAAERRKFTKKFPMRYSGVQIGLRSSSPFRLWRPEDWDDLFQQIDLEPSYLPPF